MSNHWNPVDTLPPLDRDEIQIWRVDLSNADLMDPSLKLLNPSEQLHASRLRPGQPRDHFVVGRACLRILLGNALALYPPSIEFTPGPHGKPQLADRNGRFLSFNLAHSKQTILIALAHQGSVGVDVEHFDRSIDIMEVAQQNFTANEYNSLAASSDPEARIRLFYLYWTRKEAILKADGRGLLAPLSSFDITSASMNSQPVHLPESEDGKSSVYYVSDVDLNNQNNQAAAALAFDSPDCHLNQLIFPFSQFAAAIEHIHLKAF